MEWSPITIGMLAVAALLVILRLSLSTASPGKLRRERNRLRDGGDDGPPSVVG